MLKCLRHERRRKGRTLKRIHQIISCLYFCTLRTLHRAPRTTYPSAPGRLRAARTPRPRASPPPPRRPDLAPERSPGHSEPLGAVSGTLRGDDEPTGAGRRAHRRDSEPPGPRPGALADPLRAAPCDHPHRKRGKSGRKFARFGRIPYLRPVLTRARRGARGHTHTRTILQKE